MRQIWVILILQLVLGCTTAPATRPARTRPSTQLATKPTSMPVVAKWTMRPLPEGEVNIIALGDWGSNEKYQKIVAATLEEYVGGTGKQFSGVVTTGDNFYVNLKGVTDYQWQSLFEDMYDARVINFPFYPTLGNHDYEETKAAIQQEYSRKNPDSRWKMPGRWYRMDIPPEDPLVMVLLLDSSKPKLTSAQWEEQMRWMDEQLANPRGAVWTVAVAHHPVFSNGSHGDNGVLMVEWGEIFRKYQLDFYICGHEHVLEHLQPPGWFTSFVVSGGGGRVPTAMRGDVRGPFSRSINGFAHLQFTKEWAMVRFIHGAKGTIAHQFTRGAEGEVQVTYSTGRDKATTKPLKALLGFEEIDSPATLPAKVPAR